MCQVFILAHLYFSLWIGPEKRHINPKKGTLNPKKGTLNPKKGTFKHCNILILKGNHPYKLYKLYKLI
jgi:hypothetical protein